MRHSRHFSNPLSSRLLYNALVRSKLQYNALMWNPHEDKYILMIEKVNKAFLRLLIKKEYGCYPHLYSTERLLVLLGYKFLELRRNISLLRFVFQLMRGSISCPALLERIRPNVPINFLRGRQHEYLAVPPSGPNSKSHSVNKNGNIIDDPDFDLFRMRDGKLYASWSSYPSKQFFSNDVEG
jgi:hypothetical protein